MSNIDKYGENIVSFVKKVIFKYCAYTEDRLSILGNEITSEFSIEIKFDKNESQIMFLVGNRNFKSSVPERTTVEKTINFEDLGNVIDFLLSDHRIIKSINLSNNNLNLGFAINWNDESIKGINCGDINLSLTFYNAELGNKYIYFIFQRYNTYLEQVPSFVKMKDKYVNSVKQLYLSTLNRTEMLSLLSEMEEQELMELLESLDNDVFIKYTTDVKPDSKAKQLVLQKQDTK